MAYCRLVFPLLVLSVVQSYASSVPVFLWGDLSKTSLKSNPLAAVSEKEFEDVLKEELSGDPFTVIFIEETLSVEDFSSKTLDGEVPLRYLRSNLGDSYYLPSVSNALEALNSFADVEKENHVKLTENGLSAEIEPEGGKFLFIELKDANEKDTRAELLRRHNDFMEDMFAKLHNRYEKVVAIYTARNPSWTVSESHRVRRQATEDNKVYRLDGLLLYVEDLMLTELNKTIHLDNLESSTSTFNDTSNTMITSMKFGADEIQLNFVHKNGYWTFGKIMFSFFFKLSFDLL